MFTGSPRIGPFVSPDGQWIGFVDGGGRAEESGGDRRAGGHAGDLDGAARGATWGPDDTIIFATDNVDDRPAAGRRRQAGEPTVLTRPDRAQGEADHFWPEILPGGRPCCSRSRR